MLAVVDDDAPHPLVLQTQLDAMGTSWPLPLPRSEDGGQWQGQSFLRALISMMAAPFCFSQDGSLSCAHLNMADVVLFLPFSQLPQQGSFGDDGTLRARRHQRRQTCAQWLASAGCRAARAAETSKQLLSLCPLRSISNVAPLGGRKVPLSV